MVEERIDPTLSTAVVARWACKVRGVACAALLAAAPSTVFAQLAILTQADAQYEYNTNVFAQQHGVPLFGLTTPGYSDHFIAEGGKIDATYLYSQQQFHATIIGTDYHYDRFTELNHKEYTLDAGWNWKLGRTLDGLLEVSRIQSMVSLYNLIEAQLALQTEQRETGKIGFQFVPDWRAEATGYTRKVEAPLLGAPDLALSETDGSGALKYTGTAGVTAGISAGYLRGNYTGNPLVNGAEIVVAPDYHQTNLDLTATDIVSGKSSFQGEIGYSKRSSPSQGLGAEINDISGATGLLDYRRALTGKTTLDLIVSRQIVPYITGGGSEIDSIGGIQANWQATYRIGVTLGYNYTYRQLPDQGTDNSNRTDRLNYVSLAVDYEALPWLALKPYVRYQDRTATNFVGGNFNATIVGAQFVLQWEHGVPPPPTPFQIQAQ
jgi:hypothetical protein